MSRQPGLNNFAGTLEVLAGGPLDARSVVDSKIDLTTLGTFSYPYIGMVVAVKDEGALYILKQADYTQFKNWVRIDVSQDVIEGYFNPTDKKFYSHKSDEGIYTDEIPGYDDVIYLSLDTKIKYIYFNPFFVKLYSDPIQLDYIPNAEEKYQDRVFQYVGLADNVRPDAPNGRFIVGYFYKCIKDPFDPNLYRWIQQDIQPRTGTDALVPNRFEVGNIYQYIGNTNELYQQGYFYQCIQTSIDPPRYKFVQIDVQPNSSTQTSSMPAVTSTDAGKIVQYIGTTDSDYTNGYFYKCVEDLSDPGSYFWDSIDVQAEGGSGSGGGELENSITASITVGGITSGTVYSAGTKMEQMWNELLDPTQYPTLTGPSATLTVPGDKLLESGTSVSKTFTLALNRGSINPAYGTSGYRSGVADTYSLNGGTAGSTNTFTETVSSSNKTFQGTVTYLVGEQPKDSKGNDYDIPLPAGSVNSNTINYEFVDAIWANTSNITTVAKLGLVSKSAKVKEFNFPAQTVANPEEFDVPASWTVTAVEVLNTLSNQWEDCSSEFTTGSTTHNNAAGVAVNYVTYIDNRGYAAASRKVRVKWS